MSKGLLFMLMWPIYLPTHCFKLIFMKNQKIMNYFIFFLLHQWTLTSKYFPKLLKIEWINYQSPQQYHSETEREIEFWNHCWQLEICSHHNITFIISSSIHKPKNGNWNPNFRIEIELKRNPKTHKQKLKPSFSNWNETH